MVLAAAHNLRSKCGFRALLKFGVVVLRDVDVLLDFVQLSHGNVTSTFEAISNFERVDTLVE